MYIILAMANFIYVTSTYLGFTQVRVIVLVRCTYVRDDIEVAQAQIETHNSESIR